MNNGGDMSAEKQQWSCMSFLSTDPSRRAPFKNDVMRIVVADDAVNQLCLWQILVEMSIRSREVLKPVFLTSAKSLRVI